MLHSAGVLTKINELVNFNKNYKGLGTIEKENKPEETQTGR